MAIRRDRTRHGRRWLAAATLTLVLIPSGLKAGDIRAIRVVAGEAGFHLTTPRGEGTTLVVVSTLARGPGPFPIQLRARSIGASEVRPTDRAVEADAPPRPGRPIGSPARIGTVGPGTMPVARRVFHLLVRDGDIASASNYEAVDARLAAVGTRVQVYVDQADTAGIDPGLVDEVVATFDRSVYPVAAGRFGPAEDVDGDGRFTVLISGWLDRLGGGRLKVDGFVRDADFDPVLAAPFGNRADMLALNARLRPGPHLRTVLAHEYTHAVTFTQRAFPAGPDGRLGPEEEGWVDEGLAHLVEDEFGFSRSNLDYRARAFLARPERHRLVVDDYYTADLFRGHGNRGATYLFLRHCVDRAGPETLDRLVRTRLRGLANVEAATGRPFEALFRDWTVALFLRGIGPGGEPIARPRFEVVRPDGPDDAWQAAGTTTHYALVEGSRGGAVRVEVSGPAEAEVQVTTVDLPPASRPFGVFARPKVGPDRAITARLRFEARGTADLRLDAIRFGPVAGPGEHAWRGMTLDRTGIERRFGTALVPAGGSLAPEPIRLDGLGAGEGPIVVEAIASDPAGSRVAATTEIDVEADGG